MGERLQRFSSWRGGYPMAAASVIGLAVLCLPLRGQLPLPALLLLFVPAIVAIARLAGSGVSAFSSVAAFLLLDFLFVEPYHRLTIHDPSEWIALGAFLVVSIVTGRQTARLREREEAALERQRELSLLNRLSASVVSEKSAVSTAGLTARQVVQVLGGGRAAVFATEASEVAVLAEAGEQAEPGEADFVAYVRSTGKAIGLPADSGSASDPRPVSVAPQDAVADRIAQSVYLPLQSATRLEGVLLARGPADGSEIGRSAGFLVGVANIAALALERERLEEEAARLAAEHEADRLKSTIVSSVSHELKTPLAAATARITGLLDATPQDPHAVRAEIVDVSADLERLNRSIGDLLDLSRLESDAWRPRPEHYEVSEVLGSLRDRLSMDDRDRVRFVIPAESPVVDVDFTQLVRALADVVENGLRYSPPGSTVAVTVTSTSAETLIAVTDTGPGVPDAEKERVFEKFFRGSTSSEVKSGTGLGLAIAAEIVRVHSGRIWVEDARGGGARFVVALPTVEEASE